MDEKDDTDAHRVKGYCIYFINFFRLFTFLNSLAQLKTLAIVSEINELGIFNILQLINFNILFCWHFWSSRANFFFLSAVFDNREKCSMFLMLSFWSTYLMPSYLNFSPGQPDLLTQAIASATAFSMASSALEIFYTMTS